MFQELRWAIRSLSRSPGFALAALATLTLGIGATTIVFSFVNGILLRPLPFGEVTDRLVSIHSVHPTQFPDDWDDAEVSYADFEDFRRESETIADMAIYSRRSFTLYSDAEAFQVRGSSVSPHLFRMLTIQPMLGRDFRDEEGADFGFENVVILSHHLWQNQLGGDRDILGRPILVNERELTVIGVMPPKFRFPEFEQLWVPYQPSENPNRAARGFGVIALLQNGTGVLEAREELGAVAERLQARYPETNRAWGVHVLPYRETITNPGIRVVMIGLLGAVGMVLLIGCGNLAGLLLARGQGRQAELALRAALGAGRARLMRPILLESLALSIVGGVLGTLAAAWGVDLTVASFPEELPYWIAFPFDIRVAAFIVGLSLVTSVVFGLLPALQGSHVRLTRALGKGSSRTTTNRSDLMVQDVLVAGQIALSLAVVTAALLMIQSFYSINRADAGFDDTNVLTLRVYLAGDAYDPVEAKSEFFLEAERRIEAIPGVLAAGATLSVPADDGGADARIVTRDRPVPDGNELGVQAIPTTTRLFDAMGLDLLSGRGFRDGDMEVGAPRVAVVNRALAVRLGLESIDESDELGLVRPSGIEWFTIVGIAPDVQYEEFSEETAQSRLNVYVPYASIPSRGMAFLIRAERDPAALSGPVRETLRAYAPGVPVYLMQTMEQVRFMSTWQQRFFSQLFGLFAAAAVALCCLGVYGLTAYLIGRRLREVAIRMAFGADRVDILKPLLQRGARLAASGLAAGVVLALFMGRVLSSILYKVSPYQVWGIAIPALALTAAVLAATYLPGLRAARVEPARLLRDD